MDSKHERLYGDREARADRAMLWSIQDAFEKQTVQIGASACGATAVVDVLKALGLDVAPEEADRCVQTRLRRNDSPLDDYLLSRSEAGASHTQLIAGASKASKGQVIGRFFHLYPQRRVRLVSWLASWIRKGAVPVATMNMQLAVPEDKEVPDAWHHQLIFGVTPNAVFMTNPLDVVPVKDVCERLSSESVLLVRSEDVLQRLKPEHGPFSLTENLDDPRWKDLDVEGQVRRVVLEHKEHGETTLTHIKIPAAYSSGVTLFALKETIFREELLASAELPLMSQS
ncbi:uncharacterized protein LOC128751282 [Synchiropus splendidus]|uniref:uncharacterized protein LOC128751282 n=1 Tax=Synchiropus splendidus TaxID=270530 RepID=UPI00237D4CE9|nr:uncharacterized protein LOC128751282 [Synchiropus splendidus]XP_053708204.1 uncharacterized protein LOC128751282 [Synchiropus splendidus]XP_053708211.1 uncharacterized protein LOC128751282 [Synchiropus splendidus]